MSTSIASRLSALTRPSLGPLAGLALAGLLAAGGASAQVASPDSAGLDTSGNPRSETAACKTRATPQERNACLQEVRNAQTEKRAGRLGNGADYAANAMRRCDVFKEAEDKASCRARVESQARLDGSVAGGGVLRQGEITVPAK